MISEFWCGFIMGVLAGIIVALGFLCYLCLRD